MVAAYADRRMNTTIGEGDRLEVQLRGGGNGATATGKETRTNSVLNLQRQLFARSERVKGIDFHPTEPWILTTLYSGMLELKGRRKWLYVLMTS